MKYIKYIFLAIIAVSLVVATFVEKFYDKTFALAHIEHSIWFCTLCGACVLLFLFDCIKYRRSLPRYLIVISVLIVLCGATVSFFTAENTVVHLRKDIPLQEQSLTLTLKNFEIVNYSGTNTPADFISDFEILENGKTVLANVSMNNTFRYKNYRFFQTSYDSDSLGTILTINNDFIGSLLVYCGFALFVIAAIFYFLKKRLKKFYCFIALLPLSSILPAQLPAQSSSQSSSQLLEQKTISKENADELGRIACFYQGRISPLNTYARDFVLQLYGKSSYKNFTAEQIFAGWLFFPEVWQHEEMIKIKSKEVRKEFGIKEYAKFSNFFTPFGESKLTYSGIANTSKAYRELDEKINTVFALVNGYSLEIFPQKNIWYSAVDNLQNINSGDSIFIRGVLQLLYEAVEKKEDSAVKNIISKIRIFQTLKAEQGSISDTKIMLEIYLNKFNIPKNLFPVILIFALLTFITVIIKKIPCKIRKLLNVIIIVQYCITISLLTAFIILRAYISGHLPFSNGYETMLILSWIILLITFIFRKKADILFFAGQMLSGLCLLVCNINSMHPQLTPLMPVLNSIWLSIHVSIMMLSYALCALITIISVIYLIIKNGDAHNMVYKLLEIAVVLMFLGIICGSVWANQSWGRYWGWDPKEVWALVTGIVYLFPLFDRDIKIFQNKVLLHSYLVFAFLSLLMTYFGVSLFLGGLHSY
ncbi:MAG: cytochrome c biogenesis protein CcsA [Bacteroidales bacterium]|nr:cytochrome c biogenesis protein CcsA [Bacteroidales bacterium]